VVARQSPALIRDLISHAGQVTACAVAPDGLRVVSASNDRTLKVWDLESGDAHAAAAGVADQDIDRERSPVLTTPDRSTNDFALAYILG